MMEVQNDYTEMEGVETNGNGDNLPILLPQERRILELYGRMEELQFEITLLKQQGILSSDLLPREVSEDEIHKAQEELLEAKAAYTVRSNVVSNVLTANPILKAVHAGSNASILEQDLLPLVEKRDKVSKSLTELSTKARSAQEELIKAEIEHIQIAQKNIELTSTMLDLAEQASTKKEDVSDLKTLQKLNELEASMKISRQRWRILKETASATIVGSGIDWARDPKLLEIILDDDGNDD